MVSFEIRGIVYGRKKEIKLEIQLLPKDLLTDLEKGDRTMEMLKVDSPPQYYIPMEQVLNQTNALQQISTFTGSLGQFTFQSPRGIMFR